MTTFRSATVATTITGPPAAEFRLLPFGPVTVDRAISGRDFEFTRTHAQQALEWFARQGRSLAIDYEHQTMAGLNARADWLAPAAGWIGALQIRSDGLWATRVEWTAEARRLLAGREYRYFSPVIYWAGEYGGELAGLGPVALTNDPAMHSVPALVASRGGGVLVAGNVLRELVGVLGLSPSASVDDIMAAVTEDNRAQVAELLGLPSEAKLEDLRRKIETLRISSVSARWKAAYRQDATAQREFGSRAAFVAYKRAEAASRVGIVGKARPRERQAPQTTVVMSEADRPEWQAAYKAGSWLRREFGSYGAYRAYRRALETAQGAAGDAASSKLGEEGPAEWERQWRESAELQAEFDTLEAWLAYKAAEAEREETGGAPRDPYGGFI